MSLSLEKALTERVLVLGLVLRSSSVVTCIDFPRCHGVPAMHTTRLRVASAGVVPHLYSACRDAAVRDAGQVTVLDDGP